MQRNGHLDKRRTESSCAVRQTGDREPSRTCFRRRSLREVTGYAHWPVIRTFGLAPIRSRPRGHAVQVRLTASSLSTPGSSPRIILMGAPASLPPYVGVGVINARAAAAGPSVVANHCMPLPAARGSGGPPGPPRPPAPWMLRVDSTYRPARHRLVRAWRATGACSARSSVRSHLCVGGDALDAHECDSAPTIKPCQLPGSRRHGMETSTWRGSPPRSVVYVEAEDRLALWHKQGTALMPTSRLIQFLCLRSASGITHARRRTSVCPRHRSRSSGLVK